MKKFFYKPIFKALEDRKKRIEESLKNADLIEDRLKKTDEKSAQILSEAQKSARELIEQAKLEAQRISDVAALDARKQIEQMLAETKIQIEAQKQVMQKELEVQTLNLVIEVVKKVLGRNLGKQEKAQITKNALTEVTKQAS